MRPKTGKLGNLTIHYYEGPVDSGELVRSLKESDLISHLGRGGIKIIRVGGRVLVSRKYLHGGLLRLLTGDRFLSPKRCRAEVDIIRYLKNKGFPVVTPFATLVEKRSIVYRLNLLTVFEEGSISLLDYLKRAPHRDRMTVISGFIHLFSRLQTLGVYHPDLHIGNVLVTSAGKLLLLDFDHAARRVLTKKDRESMLWRLWRHMGKMERMGRLKLDNKEKNHLLKTYSRVSGIDSEKALAKKARIGLYCHRVGSTIESLLYGRGR